MPSYALICPHMPSYALICPHMPSHTFSHGCKSAAWTKDYHLMRCIILMFKIRSYIFSTQFLYQAIEPREGIAIEKQSHRTQRTPKGHNKHGIYIRHCQESNSQPVPRAGADTTRPQWHQPSNWHIISMDTKQDTDKHRIYFRRHYDRRSRQGWCHAVIVVFILRSML